MFYGVNLRLKTKLVAIMVASSLSFSLLASTPAERALQREVEVLNKKIDLLEHQVHRGRYHGYQAESNVTSVRHFGSNGAVVGTGPYFGLGSSFNGSDLIINDPNINKDAQLLKQNQRLMAYLGEQHHLNSPHVQLSGKVEARAVYEDRHSNYFDLSSSELDVAALVNPWITGYTSFGYDNSLTKDSPLRLLLGFITLGNFNCSPVYASIGQMYMPFGRFDSSMSFTGPLTADVGRIKGRGFNIGYRQNGVYAAGAVYSGRTVDSPKDIRTIDQFAAMVGYSMPQHVDNHGLGFDVRVSYTNNLAESEDTFPILLPPPPAPTSTGVLKHYVDGGDVAAVVAIGPVSLYGEYTTSLEHYAPTDWLQNGHPAKPRAYQLEAAYDFIVMCNRKANVAITYSKAEDTAAINPVEEQYGANLSINILHNVVWGFEVMHQKDYPKTTVVVGSALMNPNTTFNGEHTTVSTTVDVFF